MKKRLLRLMAIPLAMTFALSAYAQEDVTSKYLTNYDFSSGTTVTNGVCTYAKDISSNGADDSGLTAVDGWTVSESKVDAMAGGLFAYGSSAWLGGSANITPATNPSGEASGNALGIIAVWGANAYYQQEALKALEAGKYTVTFSLYNLGGTTAIAENHFSFVESNGTAHSGKSTTFTVGQWTSETVEFTLTEETTGSFHIGYKSANTGQANCPKLFIDNVKIEYLDPLAGAKDSYRSALEAAKTAAESADYTNVTGTEKTALDEAIATYGNVTGSTENVYTAATEALTNATTAFTAAKASYDAYVAEKSRANGIDISIAEAVAVPTTAEEAATAAVTLKVGEYNYVNENYTKDITEEKGLGTIGGWTFASTTGSGGSSGTSQHWSGNATTYFEQSSSSWGASAYTDSYTSPKVTLSAGSYLLKVAGRASSSLTLTAFATVGETALEAVAFPSNGDTGYGIDTNGATNFSADGTYANGNKGRGFEWRYIPVKVTEDSEVYFTITGETSTSHQWFSVADAQLLASLSTDALVEEVNSLIATATAIDQSTLNTGVKSIVDEAIASGNAAVESKDEATLNAAIVTLNAAIKTANEASQVLATAKTSIEMYKEVLTNSTADDKTQYETAITTAETAIDIATTVEAINTAIDTLEAARQAYVAVAVPAEGHPFDYTFTVAGVGNSKDGWSTEITSGSIQNFVYKATGSEKNTDELQKTGFIECWNGSAYTAKLSYTKSGLRNGHYQISAYAFASNAEGEKTSFFANDKSVVLSTETNLYQKPIIEDVTVSDSTLTFGLDVESANWVGITNIELKYVDVLAAEKYAEQIAAVKALIDEANAINADSINTGVSNIIAAAVASANEAISNPSTEGLSAALDTMNTALATANTCKQPIATAKADIAKYKEVLTNSTAEDKTAYTAAITTAEAALDTAVTVEAINASIEPLEAARQTYVLVAEPTEGYSFDYTFTVAGVGDSKDGWSTNVTTGWGKVIQNFVYKATGSEKNTDELQKTGFIECWNGTAYTAKLSYTKSELRNGHYQISAYAFASNAEGEKTSFFANDKSVVLSTETNLYQKPVIEDVTVKDGTLTFGLDVELGNWVGITNIELSYLKALGADDLDDLVATVGELVNEANTIDTSKLNKGVGDILNAAIAAGENATQNPTEKGLTNAITTLKSAIELANASITAVAEANDLVAKAESEATNSTADDKTAIEAAIATAKADIDAATSIEAIEAATDSLEAARETYVTIAEPNVGYPFDYTFKITNPSFETGDATGWEYYKGSDTKVTNAESYLAEGMDGSYLFNTWSSGTQNFYVQQTVTLPAGKYNLSALMTSGENLDVTLSANNNSTTITAVNKSVLVKGEVRFVLKEQTDVVVKVASSNWFKADDFILQRENANTLTEAEADELLAKVPEGDMAEVVKSELDAAKAALEADKTNMDKYNALADAIAKANISIKATPTIKQMEDILSKTNVYTAEAKTAFEAWITKYNDATLTADEASTLQATIFGNAWHSSNEVDDLLMSAWDEATENWDSYHVNTWSTEGDSDGSDYKVPFIEYWTNSANTLAAKTLTATLTGMDNARDYTVTAWVRVCTSNGVTDAPAGVTMQVGNGDAVDVCTGEQVSGTQFYLGTFSAKGNVDTDGNLTIKFIVADGTNINWLAFKDVMVTSQSTGIQNISGIDSKTVDVYTLNGVKVKAAVKAADALKGLERGIYVVNGKKVVK